MTFETDSKALNLEASIFSSVEALVLIVAKQIHYRPQFSAVISQQKPGPPADVALSPVLVPDPLSI